MPDGLAQYEFQLLKPLSASAKAREAEIRLFGAAGLKVRKFRVRALTMGADVSLNELELPGEMP